MSDLRPVVTIQLEVATSASSSGAGTKAYFGWRVRKNQELHASLRKPSSAANTMHSPSPQLLRALRAATRTQCVGQRWAAQRTAPCGGARLSSASIPLVRNFSSATILSRDSTTGPPKSRDRGPKSDEDTQTDFGALNILGNIGTPATSIDACVGDGFHLNNGIKTAGGSGVVLVGGEAFTWRPWEATATRRAGEMLSKAGVLDINAAGGAWGLLEVLWPKPDLLVVGTGAKVWGLSKETRQHINGLGIRIDVMDTGNASAAYNLLATERGTETVAAALLPLGWAGR